jgi:spore germination cell wall hydrolase CwlJ-like protein
MKLGTKIGLIGSIAVIASMIAIGVDSADARSNFDQIVISNTEVDRLQYIEISKQINCLAENIYFEARGESNLGQRAVAWVTLNRVKDPNFPNTICEVVWEDGQFSWTQDGKSDAITDQIAWVDALTTAWLVYNTQDRQFDPTDGATMFHATYVKPKWRKEYDQTSRIDNHVFYKNFVKPS